MQATMTDDASRMTTTTTTTTRAPHARRRRHLRVAALLLALLVIVLARPASQHARAASLLAMLSEPTPSSMVREERLTLTREGDANPVPARLYLPMGVQHPPGIVLVHGVHHRGIEEPRLERFARAIAGAGVAVLTPAVKELSDYKVAPRSIDTVGAAVKALRARLSVEKVGVMGMSFGGGISLLTAADPRFADRVSFVVAVGAHDDLGRVSRFFVNDAIPTPDGETRALKAHGYGVMVLVYSHVEDFFPPEDVPHAAAALHLWIVEKREDARREASSLSVPSRAKIERLFDEGPGFMKAELLAVIDKNEANMAAVSPRGRLGAIRANVYLLHGESDTVIPSTETLWLAKDVPPARLRSALVSPAVEHVELRSPSALDKWALVHFMGEIIGEAEATR